MLLKKVLSNSILFIYDKLGLKYKMRYAAARWLNYIFYVYCITLYSFLVNRKKCTSGRKYKPIKQRDDGVQKVRRILV